MKSIYNQDDLRCNSVGLELVHEGKEFFQSILDKYPDYDPRELVGILSGHFHLMADRRILELRRLGDLKQDK